MIGLPAGSPLSPCSVLLGLNSVTDHLEVPHRTEAGLDYRCHQEGRPATDTVARAGAAAYQQGQGPD